MDPITSKDVWLLLIVTIVATSIIIASLYERTIARFQEREIRYYNRVVELEADLSGWESTWKDRGAVQQQGYLLEHDNEDLDEFEAIAQQVGWGQ